MNNAQVAKVVLAAHNALAETQGGAPGKSWEQLNDQERSGFESAIGAHTSAQQKGISADALAQQVPESEKLKTYITQGIVSGFSKHEQGQTQIGDVDKQNEAQRNPAQMQSIEDVRQGNALARQNAEDRQGGDAKDIHEALERADRHSEQTNK